MSETTGNCVMCGEPRSVCIARLARSAPAAPDTREVAVSESGLLAALRALADEEFTGAEAWHPWIMRQAQIIHGNNARDVMASALEFAAALSLAPAPDTRTLAEVRASIERDRLRVEAIRFCLAADAVVRPDMHTDDEQGLWHLSNMALELEEAAQSAASAVKWIPRLEVGR